MHHPHERFRKPKELLNDEMTGLAKLELQLDANRRNALKSTGPKTEEGKKKVSQNAVKHGLYAKNIVIDSPHLKEDPEEYELLYNSMMADLQPIGRLQIELVLKLVNCFWRQQRLILAENGAISEQLGPRPMEAIEKIVDPHKEVPDVTDDPQRFMFNKANCIPRRELSNSLVRYERHLDLQIWRTFKMLRLLKYYSQPNTPHHPTASNHTANPVDAKDTHAGQNLSKTLPIDSKNPTLDSPLRFGEGSGQGFTNPNNSSSPNANTGNPPPTPPPPICKNKPISPHSDSKNPPPPPTIFITPGALFRFPNPP